MYHLLVGKAPFDDVPVVDKLYHQVNSKPKPIQEHRGDLPASLAKIIEKLMEKKPRWRPKKPQHVAAALMDVMKILKPMTAKHDNPAGNASGHPLGDFEETQMPATVHIDRLPFLMVDDGKAESLEGVSSLATMKAG